MKVIICENIEEFELLQNEINTCLLKKIPDYNAYEWALPIYSTDKSKIACPVEFDGIRGVAMAEVIKGYEIAEIQNTDAFWFNQET